MTIDMIRCCQAQALGEMKTTYGIYYVFGNHDKGYYPLEYRSYSGEDLIRELEKNNVHVMEDDVQLIDNRFYIILSGERIKINPKNMLLAGKPWPN